ncbi:hypothetical protein [Amycolatopsis sp. NPDC051903]
MSAMQMREPQSRYSGRAAGVLRSSDERRSSLLPERQLLSSEGSPP